MADDELYVAATVCDLTTPLGLGLGLIYDDLFEENSFSSFDFTDLRDESVSTAAWCVDWRFEEVLIFIEESRSLKLLSLKFVKVVFGLFFGSRLILQISMTIV
jgi:hypothetical protein